MCISSNVIFFSAAVLYLWVLCFATLLERTESSAHCSSYGNIPCTFVPAPPGLTPPCAKPGLTYCEHPDKYPVERIHYLIQKWRFDHATLIINESEEDFTAYYYPPPTTGYHMIRDTYGPPPHQGFVPAEPIYIPKPSYPVDANFFNPKNQNFTSVFPDIRHYKYSQNIPSGNYIPPDNRFLEGRLPHPNYVNNFNPIDGWNREDNYLFKARTRRSALIKQKLKELNRFKKSTNNGTSIARLKRQASGGETLCPTRSSFIMPKAALNNKGNWMYIVNMPETDKRYTQLVKSEVCSSQTCSGLCSLPVGYSARCEQKYIQKRLVALEGGGEELYTDLFWIPSCCVCTISNN